MPIETASQKEPWDDSLDNGPRGRIAVPQHIIGVSQHDTSRALNQTEVVLTKAALYALTWNIARLRAKSGNHPEGV